MALHQRHRSVAIDDTCPSTSSRCPPPPVSRARRQPHRQRAGRRSTVSVSARAGYSDFGLFRGPPPVPRGLNEAVVPEGLTQATPLLSDQRVVDRLGNAMHQHAVDEYGAFFSSALGGITRQPALMVVPADDQIVHRGYAVWENIAITDGHLYQLDRHIERLLFSAELAGLQLPMPPAALKRIVLDTAAASLKINGIVKVWLTGGRGSLGLGQAPGMPCELYVLATSENKGLETEQRIKGWRAARSPIPPLLPPLSVVKGTSQLHAAMAQLEVESRGYEIPLFTYGDDDDTVVAFGVDNAFAIIDEDDVLITMPQDDKVPSVAMQRLIEIIPAANKKCPDDVVVKGFDQRPLTVEDVLKAKEAFVISTADSVMGIVSIDDKPVADGEPGVTTLALHQILNNDKQPRPGSEVHTEVPFGYVTGMWSQLQ